MTSNFESQLNQERVKEFREYCDTENSLMDFKKNFRYSLIMNSIIEVMSELKISNQIIVNKNCFSEGIIEQIYIIGKAILIDPTEENVLDEVRISMEMEFYGYGILGILKAILGGWAACKYLGLNINFYKLKTMAIEFLETAGTGTLSCKGCLPFSRLKMVPQTDILDIKRDIDFI